MRNTIWTLLIFGLCAGTPAAAQQVPASPPSAASLAAFNGECQDVWSRLSPAIMARIQTEATAQLAAVHSVSSKTEVSVTRVRGVHVDLAAPFGFSQVTNDRFEMAFPLRGGWTIDLDVDFRIRKKIWRWWATFHVPVHLIVEDVRVTNLVRLDASDPDRPTIQRVEKPQVSFKVKLRSHGLFYGLLFRLLSPLGNSLAHKALDKALKGVGPSLAKAQGFPGPVPGAGAAAYTDSGAATPFETVANNVAAKAVRDNLPFGTVLMAEMDTPQTNSWLDAYGPGGTGNSGQAVRWHDYGDSAIWTGHFLGSQALRYHETGDPDALAAVRKALTGLGDLLDVYGGTGLLARYAAPISSHVGQYITSRPGGYRQATLHGQTWVAEDKDNNISRDQYCGAFFGFSLTYDLVADPTIKAEAGRRLLQMLDYLIAHDWWVDEDRHAFDASANSDMATFYRWSADQRMNYLLMGNLIAPHRYDGELQKVSRLAPFSWLSAWIGTSTLNGYYKFNLSHVTYYNYFRHETDAGRWQDVARGFRIMRRYVGHHRNPHFDLIACTVDPSLQGTLFPGSRESLRRFVTRNHRFVAPPVVDLSGVQWITVTMPVQSGSSITNQQVQIPAEPLDVPLQNYETHFLWQRSPFNHATPNQGNPRWEKPGTDLLLPYWMGRHEGAF